jgi:carboxypeptidase C (cathepsin A)
MLNIKQVTSQPSQSTTISLNSCLSSSQRHNGYTVHWSPPTVIEFRSKMKLDHYNIKQTKTMTEVRSGNGERCREWRMKNAEKLWARAECECGSSYSHTNKRQHFRSQKHKRYEEYKMTLESVQKQLEVSCLCKQSWRLDLFSTDHELRIYKYKAIHKWKKNNAVWYDLWQHKRAHWGVHVA